LFLIPDIDECIPGGGNDCDHYTSNCIDTAPDFECECKTGYTGDGYNCTGRTIIKTVQNYINVG